MDAHPLTNTTDHLRILVPLDGSPLSEAALPMASLLAASPGGSIHLDRVHVHYAAGADVGFPIPDWDEEIKAGESKYLTDVESRFMAYPQIEMHTELLDGPVGGSIADHAKKLGASLIVISTHGRTGLSRAWLGSTADWLARFAPVPVLLVRPVEGDAHARVPTVSHLLVPLDGSAHSEKILPHAVRLAERTGAHLTLVRVVHPYSFIPATIEGPVLPPPADEASTLGALRRAKAYLEDVAGMIRHAHGTLELDTIAVANERVADALVECAKNASADVIAMSTHGRGASRLLVGSVADKVMRQFTGAILVLGPVAAREEETAVMSKVEAQMVMA